MCVCVVPFRPWLTQAYQWATGGKTPPPPSQPPAEEPEGLTLAVKLFPSSKGPCLCHIALIPLQRPYPAISGTQVWIIRGPALMLSVCLPAWLFIHGTNNSSSKLLTLQQPVSLVPHIWDLSAAYEPIQCLHQAFLILHGLAVSSLFVPALSCWSPPCEWLWFWEHRMISELKRLLWKHQSKAVAVVQVKIFSDHIKHQMTVHCHQQLIRKVGHFCVIRNANTVAETETKATSDV